MKTQLILLLFDLFVNKHVVNRVAFCKRHKISERTFYRYLNDIVSYFKAHKPYVTLRVADPVGDYYLTFEQERQ